MTMLYRIRYKDAEDADEAEAVVEANSPTEAVVKFRHARDGHAAPAPAKRLITSVYAEYYGEDAAW